MRLTIKSLKEAFISESNRASNLSLGRAFFQDFEIAHFLSAAYEICFAKRLSKIDERYVSMDNRQKVPPGDGIPNNMHLMNDLGLLWGGSINTKNVSIAQDTKSGDDGTPFTNGQDKISEYAKYFRVRRDFHGLSCHVLNPRIIEYDGTVFVNCKIMRPITSLDASKLSLVYTDDKYMPYVYYQIRRYGSQLDSGKALVDYTVGTGGVMTDLTSDYIECVYRGAGKSTNTFTCSYDFVINPNPITEDEVKTESNRFIECNFSYEIVLQATQLAMESLGSERSNTLAQLNQQTQQ